MLIESVGKRRYAFGLSWTERSRKPGKPELLAQRKALDPAGRSHYYACICASASGFRLGGGISTTRVRGTVYSYAASIATRQPDGLYVVAIDDERAWFVVLSGGTVVPETDVIDTREAVLARVDGLRQVLGLTAEQIFAGEGLTIQGGSQAFDPMQAVLGLRKPVPLRALSTGVPWMPVAVAAAAVVIAMIGVKLYHRHEAAMAQAALSAKQRQQLIRSYHVAVQGALSSDPQDPQWVQAALQAAMDRLPPFLAGWHLSRVACVPAGCDGVYEHGQGLAPYALTPFQERFGAVGMHPEGNALRVHLPLGTSTVPVNDMLLRHPPAERGVSMVDFVGESPLHVAGLSQPPVARAINLAMVDGGARVGYPAFMIETVTLQGQVPVVVSLPSLLHWLTPSGFAVTSLKYTTGYGNAGLTAWNVTAVRIHR